MTSPLHASSCTEVEGGGSGAWRRGDFPDLIGAKAAVFVSNQPDCCGDQGGRDSDATPNQSLWPASRRITKGRAASMTRVEAPTLRNSP